MTDELRVYRKVEAKVLATLIRTAALEQRIDERSIAEQTGVSVDIVRTLLEKWRMKEWPIREEELLALAEDVISRSGCFESIPREMRWELFEKLVGRLLAKGGLDVFWNVRLRRGDHKYQFDLMALGGEAIYVVECKRWHRTLYPSLRRALSSRSLERMEALESALRGVLGEGDVRIYLVPVVIAPHTLPSQEQVFFVSLRHLRSFLSEHPATLESPPVRRLLVGSRPSSPIFSREPFKSSRIGPRLN
ncbi:MAG: NERD domain-containing protein [Thaumarchaeota archaeon]|nr:NERD domain-containing protein [Candidatus Calditenuaceae archaeon]MDW8187101.1 nuclease-related domain-containing protein [Nitrososphaerota archaeon]